MTVEDQKCSNCGNENWEWKNDKEAACSECGLEVMSYKVFT